jgi:hypothetical protein
MKIRRGMIWFALAAAMLLVLYFSFRGRDAATGEPLPPPGMQPAGAPAHMSEVSAVAVEEYPTGRMEPSVLILQRDRIGPIHVMWGVPKATGTPAVLVTAYRPDPERWSPDFTRRK